MKEVNEELEGSNPIWCSGCGEWIEEPCEHQVDPDDDYMLRTYGCTKAEYQQRNRI